MAWLWTALKSDFRPTFAFDVSVVLLQSPQASWFALPVLSRNLQVQPIAPARLLDVQLPAGRTAAAPGDAVTITGQFLSGASLVSLTNQRLGLRYPPFAPTSVSGSSISFTVPNDPANLPAGVYNVAMLFVDTGGLVTRSTQEPADRPCAAIRTSPAPTVATNAAGTIVTVTFDPVARANQSVSLALGGTGVPAQTFDVPSASLSFQFPCWLPDRISPGFASTGWIVRWSSISPRRRPPLPGRS